MLRHTPKHSSNIENFAYNPERRELHVTFKHGGEYIYQDVDQDHFHGMKDSDSPGSYHHEHVKSSHGFRRP